MEKRKRQAPDSRRAVVHVAVPEKIRPPETPLQRINNYKYVKVNIVNIEECFFLLFRGRVRLTGFGNLVGYTRSP